MSDIAGILLVAWLSYWIGRGRRKIVYRVPDGFVHTNHMKDPEHFDREGRYLYWGM